jgi:hypothetical protein
MIHPACTPSPPKAATGPRRTVWHRLDCRTHLMPNAGSMERPRLFCSHQIGKKQSAITWGERMLPSYSPLPATSPSRQGGLQKRRQRVASMPLRGASPAIATGVSAMTTASCSAEIQCALSSAWGWATSPALVLPIAHASSPPASDPD